MRVIKGKKIAIIAIFMVFMIGGICFARQMNKENNIAVHTSGELAQIEKLPNNKIGWGIKRNNNSEQPDVGKKNMEILDKYNGIYMGNKEKKYVYLTFDMGYEAGYTEKILEVLKQNDVKATFFITAHYVNTQPDMVKRMIDEGHIIGNHTVNNQCLIVV